MLVLVILALCLSLASIAVGLILVFRVSTLYGDTAKLAKWQGELENSVKGAKQAVEELERIECEGLPGFSYDLKTNTVTVAGNLSAKGWIASGGTKKEE